MYVRAFVYAYIHMHLVNSYVLELSGEVMGGRGAVRGAGAGRPHTPTATSLLHHAATPSLTRHPHRAATPGRPGTRLGETRVPSDPVECCPPVPF